MGSEKIGEGGEEEKGESMQERRGGGGIAWPMQHRVE